MLERVGRDNSLEIVMSKEKKKEIQSDCPAFGEDFRAKCFDCQECKEVYPEEYEECRRLSKRKRVNSKEERKD